MNPTSAWINVNVQIGHGTVIWPGSVLRGDTTTGSHYEIGPGTTLDCANMANHARAVGS